MLKDIKEKLGYCGITEAKRCVSRDGTGQMPFTEGTSLE